MRDAGKIRKAVDRRRRAAVVALGAALRSVVVVAALYADKAHGFFAHGLEMGWLGQSLLEGHGLSSPFGVPTGPTAFLAPGYPLLVALAFRLFGSYSMGAAAAMMSLNLVATLVTIYLVMRIAAKLFDERAALVAGLVWACAPVLWWMPTICWETSLSACALTALIACALEMTGSKRVHWLLLGGCCAIAALINPALLPAIVCVLVWLAWARGGSTRQLATHLGLALLAFALFFSPWPLRNAHVFHAFIPLRTTVGLELWMGNHKGADGYLQESLFPSYNADELAKYQRLGEVAYTADKQRQALAYMAAFPGQSIGLTALRTVRFWSGTGTRNGSVLFAAHALLTTCFGLAGLLLVYRRKGGRLALLLALPLLLFPLPYCITHAEFRYRLVLDPLLTAMAGCALCALWQTVAKRSEQVDEQRALIAR